MGGQCDGRLWESGWHGCRCTLGLLSFLPPLTCALVPTAGHKKKDPQELGTGVEISLLQAIFILFPDFSNRCSGALQVWGSVFLCSCWLCLGWLFGVGRTGTCADGVSPAWN